MRKFGPDWIRDLHEGPLPQGSLLGPLLFLIYINDLPTVASESVCFGYADDYKLLSTSHELLESDLINLHNWCVANKRDLRDDKCSLIHFKKQSVDKMNEVAVKPVKVQKDLDVLISKTSPGNKTVTCVELNLWIHCGSSSVTFPSSQRLKPN